MPKRRAHNLLAGIRGVMLSPVLEPLNSRHDSHLGGDLHAQAGNDENEVCAALDVALTTMLHMSHQKHARDRSKENRACAHDKNCKGGMHFSKMSYAYELHKSALIHTPIPKSHP